MKTQRFTHHLFLSGLLLALVVLFNSATTSTAVVKVKVSNIKNNKGKIILSYYNTADQFPDTPTKAYTFSKAKVKEGKLTLKISGLKAGTYAFSLLDDANGNSRMDKNFLGIPKEGFGFSNNAKIKGMSGPDFNDSKVKVAQGENQFSIKVKYM